MTGYTVHSGSNDKFAEGWDHIFGGDAPATKKTASKKKATAKKAAPKKSAKGKKKSTRSKRST